jgi:hypothetical protein
MTKKPKKEKVVTQRSAREFRIRRGFRMAVRRGKEAFRRLQIARNSAERRRERIMFRKSGLTVPQEQDRWPANWKPLTIKELFDR